MPVYQTNDAMNFEQTFKNIDDVLWKDAGADSELDYIGQTSWILFLRYLDELEMEKEGSKVVGFHFFWWIYHSFDISIMRIAYRSWIY